LSEQVMVMKVLSPGLKFFAYSTKLSKVVCWVKGREANMKHREEVGTRDKAQAIMQSAEARRSYKSKPETFTGRAVRAL